MATIIVTCNCPSSPPQVRAKENKVSAAANVSMVNGPPVVPESGVLQRPPAAPRRTNQTAALEKPGVVK